MRRTQIFCVVLSFLFLGSCTTVTVNKFDANYIPPAEKDYNSRNPSAENQASEKTFSNYFEKENYLGRLARIKTLAAHLRKVMESKNHPRQFSLDRFVGDVETELSYLNFVEREPESLEKTWLPKKGSYEYDQKLSAVARIIQSAKVLNQIDQFVLKSKILEDDSYEQNFYLSLMNQATANLEKSFLQERQLSAAENRAAVMGYVRLFSDTARLHLHKVFNKNEKESYKRVANYFQRLPAVTSGEMAKQLVSGPEYTFAKSYLAYAEGTESSDIEGFDAVKKVRLATYLGLETIRQLYLGLN